MKQFNTRSSVRSRGCSLDNVSLAIGFNPVEVARLPLHILPYSPPAYFIEAARLNDLVIKELKPCLIVSPLVFQDCDALELALRLAGLGYRGCYRVVSGRLPRPDIVKAELCLAAPDLCIEWFDREPLSYS
ncbi:hypothetical protein [uncultured Litoreibacter sp.]|uniref:hypothetical protein n=1 Tax=uncultured Litoreibacter sp. TaxID=1392394 RepID=UPI00260B29C4|nr:hypothetical protein [uncultured Litoreibacter sp.]